MTPGIPVTVSGRCAVRGARPADNAQRAAAAASPAGPVPGRCPSAGGIRPPPAAAPGSSSLPTTAGPGSRWWRAAAGWSRPGTGYMGWGNPPVSWRELQSRVTWGAPGNTGKTERVAPFPVGRVPLPGRTGTPWAELHCHSSFSFLDGAATPGELVAEAARLGLETLALTDHDGMYGVPQFAQAAARLRDQGGPPRHRVRRRAQPRVQPANRRSRPGRQPPAGAGP